VRKEYEIKFRLDSPDDLIEVFGTAGAEFLGDGPEVNHLFDTGDGALRARGVVLRLREDHGGVLLTVKETLECEGVKGRMEHEFRPGGGYPEVAAMLEVLGYRETFTYSKRRRAWRLPCGVTACLDELPAGLFLELEGDSPEAVLTAAARLGFSPEQGLVQGYPSLSGHGQP
jgi:adenylate cyclase class IV